MVAEGRASGKAVAPQFAADGGGITAHHAAGRAAWFAPTAAFMSLTGPACVETPANSDVGEILSNFTKVRFPSH